MFEFDPAKSAAHKAKHGIDFDEARALWEDDDSYVVHITGVPEDRWVLVARLKGRHWSMIFTRRSDNIRIISVRRAREKEVKAYEQAQTDQR